MRSVHSLPAVWSVCAAVWSVCAAVWPVCAAVWSVYAAVWSVYAAVWSVCAAVWSVCATVWSVCATVWSVCVSHRLFSIEVQTECLNACKCTASYSFPIHTCQVPQISQNPSVVWMLKVRLNIFVVVS